MKKLILTPILFLVIISVQAQYSTYKNAYNHKDYVRLKSDKYSPTLAGLLSIVPSAGLFYVEEPGHASLVLLGLGGSFGLLAGGAVIQYNGSGGAPLLLLGAASFFVVYIWSIHHAVKVAKVKNLKIRDSSVSFRIEPFLNSGFQNAANFRNAGLTLKFKF